MINREKIIKGIDICLQRFHCGEDCPYHEIGCMEQLREDTLIILKEQEPVKPDYSPYYQEWSCGNCGKTIVRAYNFCNYCGRKVKWDD
jgi:hypothetical protein